MRSFIHTMLACATATAAIVCVTSPASAATVIVGGYTLEDNDSFGGQFGVHTTGTQTGNLINAFVNGDGSLVTFFSSDGLSVTGSGEATVVPLSGLMDALRVTFEKGWDAITFSFAQDKDTKDPGIFSLVVNNAATFTGGMAGNCATCTIGGGQNKFTLSGSGITKLEFTFVPGIGTAKQFRVDNVGAIPEPATWAMMLIGFAGIGFSMRRKAYGNVRVQFA